jgi:hypothetical protein
MVGTQLRASETGTDRNSHTGHTPCADDDRQTIEMKLTAYSTPTSSLLQYLKQSSSPQISPSHLSRIVIAGLFQRTKINLRHGR